MGSPELERRRQGILSMIGSDLTTSLILANKRGMRFVVTCELKTLGRAPGSDYLVDCTSVSRAHAKIRLESPNDPLEMIIEDLSSLNGTFVGDERISVGRARLGDLVRFGNIAFTVRESNYSGDESTIAVPAESISEVNGLSPAQQRVFVALLDGNSEKDVAEKLNLSPHTVHNHVREIYARFEVHSRAELMAKCLLAQDSEDSSEG